jgi:hypothetical protein
MADDWKILNDKLRVCTTEKEILKLFKKEYEGKRRPTFLLRIQGRLNRIRSRAERRKILDLI